MASLKASVRSLLAKFAPAPPSVPNIEAIESSISDSEAPGPQIDSLTISRSVVLPVNSSGRLPIILPAVARALQIASPMISHIFTISLNKICITACINASFIASKSAFHKSFRLIFGINNLGSAMSPILRQKGSSISLMKSITDGVNKGGLGQSIVAKTLLITSAPGNSFSLSTRSRRRPE